MGSAPLFGIPLTVHTLRDSPRGDPTADARSDRRQERDLLNDRLEKWETETLRPSIERLKRVRTARDDDAVKEALERVREAARGDASMEAIYSGVKQTPEMVVNTHIQDDVDVVLIGTVGVGQDELDVAELAHTTAVVNVPGLGDDIQALKAGILEIGDVFVLNKADRPGADDTERQLLLMLHMRDRGLSGAEAGSRWESPLLRTVASREVGIANLVDACLAHRSHLESCGALGAASVARARRFVLERVRERATAEVFRRIGASDVDAVMADVATRHLDPYSAADRLVATPTRANPTAENATRGGRQKGAVRGSHGDPPC